MPKLTEALIEACEKADKLTFLWDVDPKGFGVQITTTGVKSYVLQYRNSFGRSRRLVIARVGVLKLAAARTEARKLLGDVARGLDPAAERGEKRGAPTMGELFDRYLKEHVAHHNRPSTAAQVKDMVEKRLRPALGARKVLDVRRETVHKIHQSMASTPRLANYVIATLSKVFSLAEEWGLRPAGDNPCRKITRFRENARDRFLTREELARVGLALDLALTEGLPWKIDPAKPRSKHVPKKRQTTLIDPIAVDVIRVLLFSGCRLSEILELEWRHVDSSGRTLALPGAKGGGRTPSPVSDVVADLIDSAERIAGSPWVFPRRREPEEHISKSVIENAWQRIRAHAGIPDVRIHDLRHTVGTYASNAGVNSFVIRDLLRHRDVSMTSRYVNKSDGPVRDIANAVGEVIARGLAGKKDPADRA